jgi:gliding motility-associated-like protein
MKSNLVLCLFLLYFIFGSNSSFCQVVLAFQGAEVGDTWSYTSSGAGPEAITESSLSPNILSGSGSIVVGGNTGGGSCFSGGSGNGPNTFRNFVFNPIDISSSSNSIRTLTFNFGTRHPSCNGTGWDSGENLVFTPVLDGVPLSPITIISGAGNANYPISSNQYSYEIPKCVGTFSFTIGVNTNRKDELLFLDDVRLTCPVLNAAIVEPDSISGPLAICSGGLFNYSVPIFNGQSVVWDNIPVGASSSYLNNTHDTIVLDFNNVAIGNYSLSARIVDSCGLSQSAEVVANIQIIDEIDELIISGPDTICNGASIQLFTNYIGGLTWSNGAITDTISIISGGVYHVDYVSQCGVLSASKNITELLTLEAEIFPEGPILMCDGESINLYSSLPGANSWSTGDLADSIIVSHEGLVYLTNTNYCGTSTDSILINYIPTSIDYLISSSQSHLCNGDEATLSIQVNSGATAIWESTGEGENLVVMEAGVYVVELRNECLVISDSVTITSSEIQGEILANPQTGEAPLLVDFSFLGSGSDLSYTWDFGNASFSNDSTAQITYNESGTFVVNLLLTDQFGCELLLNDIVKVTEIYTSTIFVPNSFTPNNDGFNDVFYVKHSDISEFSILIFNRWGNEIYKSNNVDFVWNATNRSGDAVSDGTYVYIIEAKGLDKVPYQLTGFIQLIR